MRELKPKQLHEINPSFIEAAIATMTVRPLSPADVPPSWVLPIFAEDAKKPIDDESFLERVALQKVRASSPRFLQTTPTPSSSSSSASDALSGFYSTPPPSRSLHLLFFAHPFLLLL